MNDLDRHPGQGHRDPGEMELRLRALESVLTQKGYIDPVALDRLIDTYQSRVGPRNGARVVARAWVDPAFREWLFADASAAIASLGYAGRQGEHMLAVANTPTRHNLVVCTLCSCYPWPVLGLPPTWYKSAPYRSRAVRDARGVLADFGVVLPESTEIRVWDSTAELRYLVLPERPAGTESMDEQALASLVTRDSMIGRRRRHHARLMSYLSHADLGGQSGHGAVMPEPEDERFHAAWEPRALALTLAMGATGTWNIDMSRAARETLPDYASLSYYEIWVAGLEKLLRERGLLDDAEIAAASSLRPPVAVPRVLTAADVTPVLARGAPTARSGTTPPRWQAGDRVRARSGVANHHTRLPAYVRGKCGTIERAHGMHVFADAHAQGLGEQPQWLYTVVFEAVDLWSDAALGLTVSIDAWEPYLEAA